MACGGPCSGPAWRPSGSRSRSPRACCSIKDERISTTLEGLLALGVKLSLDDFGTGYASLSYLRNFRFNVLKIDRSFVSELHRNATDIKLIRAIISIARDLSLLTVAEGIESDRRAA
jgi:EAL domain-containing protein (putative c-di-GMP-specific phosphodiesterase class I)